MMNWAPYAMYNPQLAHFPEGWWLINRSPTVEPFIVIGDALFYFGPYFPAVALLRRLQAKRPMNDFVWRHPLWRMAALILLAGFLLDAIMEATCVRCGLSISSDNGRVGEACVWKLTFLGS